jgi:pimeloyl-ACP methyl ester carboxylesterase
MGQFDYEGFRVSYDEYGSGDRPIVLIHGLLMNRRMFARLAPELAERGNRVLCLDLLGHGESDRPEDLLRYSMPLFGRQTAALLDHLELEQAVIGGTSLGANVTLETAVNHPDRVRAMFIEMPVLDNALAAVAAIFGPMFVGLRFGRPLMEVVARLTSMIPRSNLMVDMVLDWLRQDPGPSISVLEGLLLGETAPHREERRKLTQPALIVGHPADPLHPFNDSGMLAEELQDARLVNANSILEWRLTPDRLDDELAFFLDDVWAQPQASTQVRREEEPKDLERPERAQAAGGEA